MKNKNNPTGELYFLEYSRSQQSYNIDSAERCITSNLKQYTTGRPSDWSVIAVGSRQDCWEALQEVRAARQERIKVLTSKNVAA